MALQKAGAVWCFRLFLVERTQTHVTSAEPLVTTPVVLWMQGRETQQGLMLQSSDLGQSISFPQWEKVTYPSSES